MCPVQRNTSVLFRLNNACVSDVFIGHLLFIIVLQETGWSLQKGVVNYVLEVEGLAESSIE
jgi:hypothetical protein